MEHKEHHEHEHHEKKKETYKLEFKKERIWQGIAAILGIVVIVMFFSRSGGSPQLPQQVLQQQAPSPQQQGPPPKQQIDLDDDPVLGDENAPVTIVSFEDYQCPFCGRAFAETFPRIKQDYIDTGKVKYVYRDFPLSFHPEAQPAAEAAECADEQGKYWEMHDLIFKNQATMSSASYKQWAQQLGLNTQQFNSCLDTGKYRQEVQDDFQYGASVGVSGTPTFFINGIKLVGAQPYQAFQQVIEAELSG